MSYYRHILPCYLVTIQFLTSYYLSYATYKWAVTNRLLKVLKSYEKLRTVTNHLRMGLFSMRVLISQVHTPYTNIVCIFWTLCSSQAFFSPIAKACGPCEQTADGGSPRREQTADGGSPRRAECKIFWRTMNFSAAPHISFSEQAQDITRIIPKWQLQAYSHDAIY